MITVVRSGPLSTVQDLGRPGYAHLGVPRSGALDLAALRRANALVGNPVTAAVVETTLLGCALRFAVAARVAVTGATAAVRLDRQPVPDEVIEVPVGSVLDVGRATAGVRSYVAVAGGIDVEPILGSRATDTLSGLGPPRLTDGMKLPIGTEQFGSAVVGPAMLPTTELELGVRLGPRDDWFEAAGLFASAYQVSPLSNRVGCRLAGIALTRTRAGEFASEGVVLGAIQVPADGQPLIFLADHPTTGGYPVIGVVDDVTPLAQARPGTTVRFRALD
ncbi:biotin-dependent carboxyltransferase family protein [Paractinoplanes rishiriensis]|uniref:Allophanate hydrolase n=1 Tax=Paractinoplanes rishiriensis TaxID=1050105 RepID=A0A919JZW3_9ACTN|nr:biotin-dependent carboxyltransferase family protein [Actinoplanes rishiriensis]GIE96342.1 allophanate hydrolase [Actinoplanes rishiriensis]